MENFKFVCDGLFLGRQPTAQDLESAKQQGVRTVIDLRLPAETVASNSALVKQCGLNYVSIPVDKAALSTDLVDKIDKALEQTEGPHLLHCATGARAALLFAISNARKNGRSAEQTLDDAAAMGFDLRTSPVFVQFIHNTISK